MDIKARNMYIFREGRSKTSGKDLLSALRRQLKKLAASKDLTLKDVLVDCLLRAGEVECALFDCGLSCGHLLASVTDQLASSFVSGKVPDATALLKVLGQVSVPVSIDSSPPEGFAYYCLHPLDYADLVEGFTPSKHVAVVGIRSIGTTLSAVVCAKLIAQGVDAARITVRPTGHPYNRRTQFTPEQREWVQHQLAKEAGFLIADEGPGMSGSSFLSVGEAFVDLGVPPSRITFLCSRSTDPASLTTTDGAQRWACFRNKVAHPNAHLPAGARQYIGSGLWREQIFASPSEWPASWTQMERSKFLSVDMRFIYKFEGLGRFGAAVRSRLTCVADAGFGPKTGESEAGFGVSRVLKGGILQKSELSQELLERIADYCAFRAQNLAAPQANTDNLEIMLRFNVSQELEIALPEELTKLEIVRPVIADGRMQPYKWLNTPQGVLKLDAGIHGDDHFFPGPTDIAWDLAGAIIEWNMSSGARDFFIDHYRKSTRDDPTRRLQAYELAYSVFRTAYCRMASAAMRGTDEECRLTRDYRKYRQVVCEQLQRNRLILRQPLILSA